MNFLKNLFKKQPIVQETLNLGKITATIHFKNGQTLEKTFVGQYKVSTDMSIFGNDMWFDSYSIAQEEFLEWLSLAAERKFVKFDEKTYLPISEIAKITTESQDHFVETKRGA